MSSITIQGLVTDAKTLTNTQSMLFPNTEAVTKLRLSNTKAPANSVTNKNALEFRNTELGGYRFVHSYSTSGSDNPTPGSLTLEQFAGDASIGTPIFTVDSNGIINVNFADITVDNLIATNITTVNIEATTSMTSPIIYATNYLVGTKIGLGIAPGVINSALEFDQLDTGRYITFLEVNNNQHEYKGFGSVAGELYTQLSSTSDSFKVKAATSSSASNTILTLTGAGNLNTPGTITATKIGINITAANTTAALQFDNARTGKQIILYQLANNIHQYRGLGTNSTQLFMQLSSTSDSFVIYAGVNSTSSNSIFTLSGGGILNVSDWVTANRASFTTTLSAGSAAIGTITQAADSVLTVQSSTQGLAIPALTTTNRNALTTTNGNTIYNSTQLAFQGYNTTTGWMNYAAQQQALFTYEVSIPTQGGASASDSWNDRLLNTTVYNTIVGCSLTSNQITLPIGIFEFEIVAAHYGTTYSSVAISRPDNSLVIQGGCLDIGGVGGNVYLKRRLSVSSLSANVFKIRSYTYTAVANYGLGKSLTAGAAINNLYLTVSILQVS